MAIKTEMIDASGVPAYLARSDGNGPSPAVVVFHEAFGLNGHIKSVADRFARAGYVALAPDLFHEAPERTAPYDNMEKAFGLVATLNDDQVKTDTGRAIEYLKSQPFVKSDRIAAVGFCLGGRLAFLAAANFPEDIKAALPFYGGGLTGEAPFPNFKMNPLKLAENIKAPMLLIFGAEDTHIPLEQVRRVEARLKELGKAAEVKVYEGAGHGFFCDERASYHAEAAADAWRRTLEFLSENLG